MMSFCRSVFFVLLLLLGFFCKKKQKHTPNKTPFVVVGWL
jgi:preprotein translocase subunit SecG